MTTLKIYKKFYEMIWTGDKIYEVRKLDKIKEKVALVKYININDENELFGHRKLERLYTIKTMADFKELQTFLACNLDNETYDFMYDNYVKNQIPFRVFKIRKEEKWKTKKNHNI